MPTVIETAILIVCATNLMMLVWLISKKEVEIIHTHLPTKKQAKTKPGGVHVVTEEQEFQLEQERRREDGWSWEN